MTDKHIINILIAGGGTGGHLYPGIAVAEELLKHENIGDVVFVGTAAGLEASVVPREGFHVEFVRAAGLVGMSAFRKVMAVYLLFLAMIDSYRIISRYRPRLIVGSGGYASFATVFAGVTRMIPTIILEQNSVPGLANRLLGKFVDVVCVTYQESMRFFPKNKTYLTGNPIRERVLKGSKVSACKLFGLEKDRFTILVFGGSLGAHSINQSIVESLQYLLDLRNDIQFLHQTGEKDYGYVRDAYRNYGFSGVAAPFIFQMAEAYAICDMIVSRAGASTLAEITAVGRPAILVPYPFAAANHQEHNARKMERLDAAFMVPDREMDGKIVADRIKELYVNEDLREEMRQNCGSLGQRNAAGKVCGMAMALIGRRMKKHV